MPHSPGKDRCTELETHAGIWRYDANNPDQVFSPKERYATGIRDGEGFDFDTAGRLYVTEHGRDQLHEDWPELYTAHSGFLLPLATSTPFEGLRDGYVRCGSKKPTSARFDLVRFAATSGHCLRVSASRIVRKRLARRIIARTRIQHA